MDVYGYAPYRYSEADELAKQMFSGRSGSTSYHVGREFSQPHNMPAPSGTPWNIQNISWGAVSPPSLVQFSAQPTGAEPRFALTHCKRKNPDIEPVIPTKQFITEEKMAAHLNGLHISSDYTGHTLANENYEQDAMDMGVTTSENSYKGPRLILSEEIKKLKDEPLLPAALIERLEKPCMSLMLWQPKETIIGQKPKQDDEENSNNNNNEYKSDENTSSIELDDPSPRNGVLVSEYSMMDVEM